MHASPQGSSDPHAEMAANGPPPNPVGKSKQVRLGKRESELEY
jgi:hypothetical protein